MTLKHVMLPNREEMLRRLLKVDSNPHSVNRFYPSLLQFAETPKTAVGFAQMLVMAIEGYVERFPLIRGIMYMTAPFYVDVLVDDQEFAEEVKRILLEVYPLE
jgi:hypothetical protein